MNESTSEAKKLAECLPVSEEQLHLAQAAIGIGPFELDLVSGAWQWTPEAASLFWFRSGEGANLVPGLAASHLH